MFKQGKKAFLASCLKKVGLLAFLKLIDSPSLLVVNFHRLYLGGLKTVFEPSVFSHSVDQFEQQLKWLSKNVNVLSEAEVLDHIKQNKPFARRSVLITFDDGYVDNYDLAFPRLKHYSIPAIFFVPTLAINERRLSWYDHVAYQIMTTDKSQLELNNQILSLQTSTEKLITLKKILSWLKNATDLLNQKILKDIILQTDVIPPAHETQSRELVTWDQLREMCRANMAIGSHSHSHRVLSSLTMDQQLQELQISKCLLETELGVTIHSVSYPVGGKQHYDAATQQLARQVGYQMGFSFNGTNHHKVINNPYEINRIETSTHLTQMVASIYLPKLFV